MAFPDPVSIVEAKVGELQACLRRTPSGELPARISELLNRWDRSAPGLPFALIEAEVRAARRWLGNEGDYRGLIWPPLGQNDSTQDEGEMADPVTMKKCRRCGFKGPVSYFPGRARLAGKCVSLPSICRGCIGELRRQAWRERSTRAAVAGDKPWVPLEVGWCDLHWMALLN